MSLWSMKTLVLSQIHQEIDTCTNDLMIRPKHIYMYVFCFIHTKSCRHLFSHVSWTRAIKWFFFNQRISNSTGLLSLWKVSDFGILETRRQGAFYMYFQCLPNKYYSLGWILTNFSSQRLGYSLSYDSLVLKLSSD